MTKSRKGEYLCRCCNPPQKYAWPSKRSEHEKSRGILIPRGRVPKAPEPKLRGGFDPETWENTKVVRCEGTFDVPEKPKWRREMPLTALLYRVSCRLIQYG